MLRIDQPEKGPGKLGEVLTELFAVRGWARLTARQQLEKAWLSVVDERVRSHTRVLVLKKGVLEVEVNHAIVLQELSSFHKRKLLAKMQAELPSTPLRELRFKRGTWKSEKSD